MVKYIEQFEKRVFTGESTKDAYLKACKWYATNVMAKDDAENIIVNYTKTADCEVTMSLSVQLDREILDRHCAICKEAHNAFFLNNKEDCSKCTMLAFHRRIHETMSAKKSYYREKLKDK